MSIIKHKLDKPLWASEQLEIFRLYKKQEFFIALFKATLPEGQHILNSTQLKEMTQAITYHNELFETLTSMGLNYNLLFEKEGKETVVPVGSQIIKDWKEMKEKSDQKSNNIKDWWPDVFETEELYLVWLKDVHAECMKEQRERISNSQNL